MSSASSGEVTIGLAIREAVSPSRVEAGYGASGDTTGGSSETKRVSSPSFTTGSADGVLGAEMRSERRFKAPISSGELIGGISRARTCQSIVSTKDESIHQIDDSANPSADTTHHCSVAQFGRSLCRCGASPRFLGLAQPVPQPLRARLYWSESPFSSWYTEVARRASAAGCPQSFSWFFASFVVAQKPPPPRRHRRPHQSQGSRSHRESGPLSRCRGCGLACASGWSLVQRFDCRRAYAWGLRALPSLPPWWCSAQVARMTCTGRRAVEA